MLFLIKKRFATFFGLVLLVIILLGLLPVTAENTKSDWFSPTQPTLADVTSKDPLTKLPTNSNFNQDCTTVDLVTKLPAKKLIGYSDPEYVSDCVVKTSFGLVGNGGRIVAGANGLAGYLYTEAGKKLIPIGVPNSTSLIYIEPGTAIGTTSQLRVVENFNSSVEKKFADGQVKFVLKSSAQSYLISDQTGSPLQINVAYIAFSGDGRFLVGNSLIGVFHYNFETKNIVLINKWLSTNPQLAVYASGVRADNNDNGGRYVLVKHSSVGFMLYDMSTCQSNGTNKVATCESKNFDSYISSQIPNYLGTSRPRFIDAYNIKLLAIYQKPGEDRTVVQTNFSANGHAPVSYAYLGLGDSFASGEGTFRYLPGTDVKDPLNKCHLSLLSYPFLIGQELGLSEYNSVACSGAVLDDIGTTLKNDKVSSNPQAKGLESESNDQDIFQNFLPGYRTQISFIDRYKPKYITVSDVGNDVGFGKIISRCAGLSDTCYNNYEERFWLVDKINSQFNRLVELYAALKQASPESTIYVVGYPSLAKDGGNCAVNVMLDNDEVGFSNKLVNYLDGVIKKAADRAGVYYVDTSQAFYGQRLCETGQDTIAVNGLTAGNDKFEDIGPLGNESYHPNAKGHELYKQHILTKTLNFSAKNPEPNPASPGPTPDDADSLLTDVPYSGYAYKTVGDENIIMSSSLQKFVDEQVAAKGFAPGKVVYVEIHSDPVQLGSFTADAKGEISGEVNIPGNLTPGFHEMHFLGEDETGQPIDASKLVFVESSTNDFDGDGILNEDDSCQYFIPSGHDDDNDGIDDTCDPAIVNTMEEVVNSEGTDNLPKFESTASSTDGSNSGESSSGSSSSGSTNTDTSKSTDQAPSNASSLQPVGGSAQGSNNSLQTNSAPQTGGNTSVNNILNQGDIGQKPLTVGVASTSTQGTTSTVAPGEYTQAKSHIGLEILIITIAAAVFVYLILRSRRKQATADIEARSDESYEDAAFDLAQTENQNTATSSKSKTNKKSKKKKSKNPRKR